MARVHCVSCKLSAVAGRCLVWDAIDLLGADRIDHGVRAIEDAELVSVLAIGYGVLV